MALVVQWLAQRTVDPLIRVRFVNNKNSKSLLIGKSRLRPVYLFLSLTKKIKNYLYLNNR